MQPLAQQQLQQDIQVQQPLLHPPLQLQHQMQPLLQHQQVQALQQLPNQRITGLPNQRITGLPLLRPPQLTPSPLPRTHVQQTPGQTFQQVLSTGGNLQPQQQPQLALAQDLQALPTQPRPVIMSQVPSYYIPTFRDAF
jgi:hypothetical protein